MRERLGRSNEILLAPSPLGRTPRACRKVPALRTSSALWRAVGLRAKMRDSGSCHAVNTERAAVTVDLPIDGCS